MNRKLYFGLIAFIVIADFLTKLAVTRFMYIGDEVPVIERFFSLVYTQNPGAAFSMFADLAPAIRTPLLLTMSLIALIVIVYLFVTTDPGDRLRRVALAIVLGGAIGNTAERIFRGAVVDFLLVYYRAFHWPAFNVADSAISVGIVLLIYHAFTYSPPPAPELVPVESSAPVEDR